MKMTEKVFTPITIGDLTVPHRIVLAPLTRFRSDEEQVPKEFAAEYYTQRASCKGLLITEATSIHDYAARYEGSPGIYSKKQVKAWQTVTTRVHQNGGKIFMQLWHIGRAAHSSLQPPVSSSAVAMTDQVRGKYCDAVGRRDSEVPRALEVDEIREIVKQFAEAAQNAIDAGFDGVEIHGANGYLIDQFLRDGVNKRTDKYGGSIENRCRFPLEVISAISEKIGNKRLGIRVSPFGDFNSMSDSDPVAVFTHFFKRLNDIHPELAYVHISHLTRSWVAYEDLQKSIIESIHKIRQVWKGKCILNLSNLPIDKIISLVEENKTDLISIGRNFIANPDLPLRLSQNLELNKPDPSTFYTHDAKGYIDYPFYKLSNKREDSSQNEKRYIENN